MHYAQIFGRYIFIISNAVILRFMFMLYKDTILIARIKMISKRDNLLFLFVLEYPSVLVTIIPL